MYSFLINPSAGTVDKNPIGHTVHNSKGSKVKTVPKSKPKTKKKAGTKK
jgi:hypothetical protein